MTLKKKIFFSFFISAFIIAVLAVFEYINFLQIKEEMKFLKVADTILSRSLQLRRHEKNLFLYPAGADEELKAIYNHLEQLETITAELEKQKSGSAVHPLINDYKKRFDQILKLTKDIQLELPRIYKALEPFDQYMPLIEVNLLDRPNYLADFLQKGFSFPSTDPAVIKLQSLEEEISALRKTGENILIAAKAVNTDASIRAESGISVSQTAILVVFPVFLFVGLGILLYISNDLVKRLSILTETIERTGAKYKTDTHTPESAIVNNDEVDILIDKFHRMDSQLQEWEEEIHKKNQQLLESRNLATIGRLASGVAHELNNPLSNIFLSAQVLKKNLNDTTPAAVRENVEDIFNQTVRVKGIVTDLLEFARKKEPASRDIQLKTLMERVYTFISKADSIPDIVFIPEIDSAITVWGDPGMLERCFINLFTNAVAAMGKKGELVVKAEKEGQLARVWVSDTGAGIPEEERDKIFDPFFTKKEKGTGLGLAIVKNIISKHHGTITVVSEEGVGTAFEITLPITQ